MKYCDSRFLNRKPFQRLVMTLAASLLLPTMSYGQRAEITGTVLDQNGAAVTGVRLVLLNLDQGLKREVVTGNEGYFAAPFLQPGHYVITAQKSGFAAAQINDLDLHVGDIRSLQIHLQVGGERVQIHVNGQSQQVETVSPALGQVVVGEVIRNAPLDGRNVLQLALLQPGVTPTDPDDNGVELYCDKPKEAWPRTPDGHLAMCTRPLDLHQLLKEAPPGSELESGPPDL